MRKVNVHFHGEEEVTKEPAYLIGDNIIVSDYHHGLVFRIVTVGYLDGDNYLVRDYRMAELNEKVSVEHIEKMSLLDYVSVVAK
ncbi:hypothetical protein V6B33_11280 [Mangrovibacillus sp. Mu-81]|uniref:hypothetical protein n=1 Tax=Mangrovibacillus sp. Mu-81 TaxID=3121478 RepID=UPI002FE4D426